MQPCRCRMFAADSAFAFLILIETEEHYEIWAGRFQKETDTLVNDFNSSIGFDARLYRQDIQGSIAHARMLGQQGIIEAHEAEKIVEGLEAILADIEADKVEFSLDNEDIHMNIEAMLTERIGDA